MTEEFKKTSVTDLVKMWIDMMRANTQHMIDENCAQWHTSVGYNKCIENLENTIASKLDISVLEVKVMLNYKKKTKDIKEKKLFKTRRQSMLIRKKKKYLNKLTKDMENIQNSIFNAHHSMVKLLPIVISDNEENTVDEAATNSFWRLPFIMLTNYLNLLYHLTYVNVFVFSGKIEELLCFVFVLMRTSCSGTSCKKSKPNRLYRVIFSRRL